ncbi:MAG: hypothetical protein F6J87_14955 [Spirulina sp. SIO3F2]|nr:hypothetical protein [Spirulina sp. SIO3F2]
MPTNKLGWGYSSTYNPETGEFILLAHVSVAGAENIETEASKGSPYFEPGSLRTYDKMERERSLEIEITIEQVVEAQEGLLLNRQGGTQTFTHPVPIKLDLVSTTRTVSGLTTDQPAQLVELLSAAPGMSQYTQVPAATGPQSSGEFSVDTDSVILHASDVAAGKVAGLRYMKQSTAFVYGGPNPLKSYGQVEVYLQESYTKARTHAIYFPRVELLHGIDLGDERKIKGEALVAPDLGFNEYFAKWPVVN